MFGMPSIPVIGVVLAAASAFVIGGLWYSPSLFLTPWLKMTGTTDRQMKERFGGAMGLMAVAALLTAYALAHFILYSEQVTGTYGVLGGVQTALWAWVGVSLTTVITSSALEARDPKLMLITAGNRLATLLMMGVILGAFM